MANDRRFPGCRAYDLCVEHGQDLCVEVRVPEADYAAQASFWGHHAAEGYTGTDHRAAWQHGFPDLRNGVWRKLYVVADPTRLSILLRLADRAVVTKRWRWKSLIAREEIARRLRERIDLLELYGDLPWRKTFMDLRRDMERLILHMKLGECGLTTIREALSEVQRADGGRVNAAIREIKTAMRTCPAGVQIDTILDGLSEQRPPLVPAGWFRAVWSKRLTCHDGRADMGEPTVPSRQMPAKGERFTVYMQGVDWTYGDKRRSGERRFVVWIDERTRPEVFRDVWRAFLRQKSLEKAGGART